MAGEETTVLMILILLQNTMFVVVVVDEILLFQRVVITSIIICSPDSDMAKKIPDQMVDGRGPSLPAGTTGTTTALFPSTVTLPNLLFGRNSTSESDVEVKRVDR